jgi:choline kinase
VHPRVRRPLGRLIVDYPILCMPLSRLSTRTWPLTDLMRSKTHIIILAAGRGSRLGALGADTPKWLLSVDGKTLADRQLEAAHQASSTDPGDVASCRVVTGYAADAIARFLHERGRDDILIVENPLYATINNWYSLLLGLRSIPDDPATSVVVFNCDLLAPAASMAQFIQDSVNTDAETLIAVDLARELTDESMKVAVRSDSSNRGKILDHIGKIGVTDPVGEYVGMLMARGSALRHLHNTLESFVDAPEMSNAWYEQAVGQGASEGTAWNIWPMPDSQWIEIDDDADYAAAAEITA